MDGVVLPKEFIRATGCIDNRILSIVIEKGNGLDGIASDLDSDGVWTRVVQLNHDEIVIVSIGSSPLELKYHIRWRL